ncbi:MAG: calcium-translocating P-type ATPase, PMCA-type [Lutispora sp.]|nr:calcium-translocating P-type ATPase, PMCA-type [Lutispora sp.]MDD4834598.1 calcium-translocating P-type ATPase, PMCA-type [Lutispora sp.]
MMENISTTRGLSEKEALEKLKKYGLNELTKKSKKGPIAIFVEQFKNLMTLVLIGAALISWFFGEKADSITILAIIVLNSFLGFIQEFKAERSIEALMELSAPGAKVIREGRISYINAKYLVPGDVLLIEAGDRIPTDGLVLESTGLMVDESLLTGESVPVEKTPKGSNKVFMGTMAASGKSKVVTYSTGMNTEMGKIASMLQDIPDEYTPLQKKLAQLGKYIVVICLAICAVVSLTGIMRGEDPYNMLLTGISLAVAAIPEGLPAIVTVSLAIGVQRMYKRNALVRKLPAVETLGGTTIICSDKTGTLTQNKMTVKKIYIDDRFIEPQKDKFPSTDSLKLFFTASAACSDAYYEEKLISDPETSGNPTELAILKAAWGAGIKKSNLDKEYKRIYEIPFDSDRKRMAVAVRRKNGESYVFVKGAVDVILDLCTKYHGVHGEQAMTPLDKKTILGANEKMAASALRVLGTAYKKINGAMDKSKVENNLVFLGMAGMIDPPRPEAAKAVETCIISGIRPIMITGDHKMTAAAIAKELGIMTSKSQIITGNELDNLNDKQLEKASAKTTVYARVSPKHKLRIVKALKSLGHIVAMTGDGVNDAPAIKEADIGIAMGITGTDVTKEASSMVLMDDNFSTIVAAVEEGRIIYDNIRKFIRYLLSCNIGEVLIMFLASLLYMPVPLIPIQILWVNLVTDGLPAMALGVDPPDKDIMLRKPRGNKEGIFSEGLGFKILMRGVAIGLGTLSVYALMLYLTYNDIQRARTCTFASLVLSQLFFVFECRSEHKSILKINPFTNIWLILAVMCSLELLLMVIYVPFFQPIFDTVPLHGIEWAIVVSMSLVWTILSIFTTKKKRR